MTSQAQAKRMNVFERYLTLWVALCMHPEGRPAAQGSHRHAGGQLARQAVLDGLFRLALLPAAALATVVGVLVEVPVMLSVCRFCLATRDWFGEAPPVPATINQR
jgi:ACR3 family arsenite efflux pump ArsB